jgi:RecB family endonuclease NucS
MIKLEYCKSRKIPLKTVHDEKWLQDRIENDPSILGLGDLEIRERERKQSTGGRIDFLAYDPKIETMYEIEVMLGAQTSAPHVHRRFIVNRLEEIKGQIINEGYPKDITFELISNIDTTIEDISE